MCVWMVNEFPLKIFYNKGKEAIVKTNFTLKKEKNCKSSNKKKEIPSFLKFK